MASKTLITPEQYLATPYEREPEYVHGEIVERSLPTKRHSKIQQRLSMMLDPIGCYPEMRLQLADDVFRIPDISVYEQEPEDEVPTVPPLAVIEIVSPDDRFQALVEKCEDYYKWGVRNIWVVEPQSKKLYAYAAKLCDVDRFQLAAHNLTITPADLFE